jgi:hypothetical protein
MNACRFMDAGAIELYFYGELEPSAAGRIDAHVRQCSECRQHLDDLRSIQAALASRRRVDAPPAGDWAEFTKRLDASLTSVPVIPPRRTAIPWLAIAATLAIVAGGVFVTSRVARERPTASSTARVDPVMPAAPSPASVADRSLVQHSEEHFERSKLVVLGLATLDPRQTRADDWEHERELAGSLLPDTRLYRIAAEDRGMTDLARVLGDLETVLVETSMSDHSDREALQRVQRLIARRDLVVKMNVVSSGI